MPFELPAYIREKEDSQTKFHLIFLYAVGQGIVSFQDRPFYDQIWNRGRKKNYWGNHCRNLVGLLQKKAEEKEKEKARISAL